jgi:hypothetical protein
MPRIRKPGSGKRTAAGDPTPNPTPNLPNPTITLYEELAVKLRTALDAVPPQIPFWQPNHPDLKQTTLRGRAIPLK